jgi:hypothetical protein
MSQTLDTFRIFRIVLAALECCRGDDFAELRQRFEKWAASFVGAQACLIPFWVQKYPLNDDDSQSVNCGAACMKHPETQAMIEAYKSISQQRANSRAAEPSINK